MRVEVSAWWEQAKDDLESARINLDNERYYVAAFLCQQAVEKALKAFLLFKTKNPASPEMTSHSLIFLGKTAKIPSELHNFLRDLSPHYTLARYPGASGETPSALYHREGVQGLLQGARRTVSWIEKQLR